MELWHTTHQWLQSALNGMAAPWVIGLALVLTSFLLEDVAIAAGAALAAQGLLTWSEAFAWVFVGIAIGDIGLYAIGLGARRIVWLRKRYIEPERHSGIKQRLERDMAAAVLLARVIPGLRLVTYTLCGFVRVPAMQFCVWVALAVTLWTAGLFWLGAVAGNALAMTLHISPSVAAALPIIAVAIGVPLFKHLQQYKRTKVK